MNSEELEKSLRTEFEAYLKKVVATMRNDASDFQKKIEAELESQRAKVAESFSEFNARYNVEHKFDVGFNETVVEHLRLARDEGAQIAANAISEAEQMEQAPLPVPVAVAAPADFGPLNEAIKEISAQQSQSTILKSLVSHVSAYADRGAFFIVKNERFIGWKTLGDHDDSDDQAVQDIDVPISSSSLLGRAVNSLSTVEGAYSSADDAAYLDPLEFGKPDQMYAVPLTARGRGVAVLYLDHGTEGRRPDLGAIEALVRVAGMTVELHANAKSAPAVESAPPAETSSQDLPPYQPFGAPTPDTSEPEAKSDFSFTESVPEAEASAEPAVEEFVARGFDPEPSTVENEAAVAEETVTAVEEVEEVAQVEEIAWASETVSDVTEPGVTDPPAPSFADVADNDSPSFDPTTFNTPSFVDGVATVPVAPVVQEAPRARLSDRNVDLPIEVADDERRLHNDARRFARLLVSEIKLYNEQKVKDGREASDLYDRLRDAIDRSREMYEKRVQPPVAAKFDYFHYELVNALGDGEASRLGSGYPGATV